MGAPVGRAHLGASTQADGSEDFPFPHKGGSHAVFPENTVPFGGIPKSGPEGSLSPRKFDI